MYENNITLLGLLLFLAAQEYICIYNVHTINVLLL